MPMRACNRYKVGVITIWCKSLNAFEWSCTKLLYIPNTNFFECCFLFWFLQNCKLLFYNLGIFLFLLYLAVFCLLRCSKSFQNNKSTWLRPVNKLSLQYIGDLQLGTIILIIPPSLNTLPNGLLVPPKVPQQSCGHVKTLSAFRTLYCPQKCFLT